MKHLMTVLALIFTQSAFAQVNLVRSQKQIQAINSAEKTGQVEQALLIAIAEASRLHQELKLDQVNAHVTSYIERIEQETRTESHSYGLKASLLGLLSLDASHSYDVTKMILANPQDIYKMESVAQGDLISLQRNLKGYFRQNELPLVYAKSLTSKALALAAKLPAEKMQKRAALVRKLYQQMSSLTVSGAHTVVKCTTSHYIAKKTSTFADLDLFFASLSLSAVVKNDPYSQTLCDSTSQTVSVSEEEQLVARLALVDDVMSSYAQKFEILMTDKMQAPYFPTWGSPSY